MNNPLQGVLGHLELLIGRPRRRGRPTDAPPDLQRSGSCRENRPQPPRLYGIPADDAGAAAVDRMLSRAFASRAAALSAGGIEVVRTQDEDVPSVDGDALLLQQALLNILINAEHAVESSRPAGSNRDIGHAPRATDSRARLDLRLGTGDSGRRHCRASSTRSSRPRGSGRGRARPRHHLRHRPGARRHDHVRNRPDGGAEFTIELPAASAPAGTAPKARRSQDEGPSHDR